MNKITIGLLNKKRGNFKIQEKFAGKDSVIDETSQEVEHHKQALLENGYTVIEFDWGGTIIDSLNKSDVDLVFNVSSMVEAALLEDLEMPYVGSNTTAIALATDKSLAKKLWQKAGLATSPFIVAKNECDCRAVKDDPDFVYPLFVKPVSGRGSAGITEDSVVENYTLLVCAVEKINSTIGQPALIELFLRGREITFGIIGTGEDARVLPPLEICYKEGDNTLTFEKKELDNDSFLCPAELSSDEVKMMKIFAKKAYTELGFKDYGRIDIIVTEKGPNLLEGNTFAGLTCTPEEKPHSYIGFMARAEGYGGKKLIGDMIDTIDKINITLMDAAGNRFVVIDEFDRTVIQESFKEIFVRGISEDCSFDPDSVLFISKSDKADIMMRIFDRDGTEETMCGNGLRCTAEIAYQRGYIHKYAHTETRDGIKPVCILKSGIQVSLG